MRGALIAGVMTVGVLTSVPARAVDSLPTTEPDIAKRLATFDPRAVAAAQHYYETPSIKTGLLAMVDNMNKGMIGLVTRNNPNLTPEQAAKVEVAVSDALKVRLDLLLRMNMVAALDTFSTDELVAMDKFYSSPEGASILQKMPKLSAQLPAMMRAFVPDYMNDVKARLKTSSPELKL
jgi:hypothetical protein